MNGNFNKTLTLFFVKKFGFIKNSSYFSLVRLRDMRNIINKLKSKVLTRLFTEWVENEFDLETLKVSRTLITMRETELKRAIDMANRVEFKGFRK